MKKVVLLSWEILEAGGINSVIMGYQSGFKKLGYNVITYHANPNGRLTLSEEEFTLQTKWFRPRAINLGWHNKDQMRQYAKDVKESDFVISVHGCPHPTKSGSIGDYGWQKIYEIPKRLKKPMALQFTDNLWDRLYKWITDVIDDDLVLLFDNYNCGYDSMTRLPRMPNFVDHPIDFDVAPPIKKSRKIDVVWLPQWKKWKGIYELIDQLGYHPDAFYTVFFNSGIEYYNLRKSPMWQKAIRYEHRPRTGAVRNTRDYFDKITHNPKSTTDYFGLVYPDQVNQIYANSKVSIDLAGAYGKKMAAQYSYCMLEPIINGCVVAASPEIANDKRSRVGGLDIVYPLEINALVDSLEDLLRNDKMRDKLAKKAWEWADETSRDSHVAGKVAKLMGG